MITKRLPLFIAALALPTMSFAAGSSSPSTPTTTETSQCAEGQVWDKKTSSCVVIKESSLSDDALYETARELAYKGRYQDVLGVIAHMKEGDTPRTLTMQGFAVRKLGDFSSAQTYYLAALELDPNHWLARSYLGQGYVETGDTAAARDQLTLIRTSGGRGTWAELSLRQAIERGSGYSY